MSIAFWYDCQPSDEMAAEVAALAPANPFCTPAHLRAKRALGAHPWVVGLRRGSELVWACPALLRHGPRNQWLEIETLPSDPDAVFWTGLRQLCRRQRVTVLEVWTMATPQATLPPLPGEQWRRRRVEHVLSLAGQDLWGRLSGDQKRHIKRARKAGVELRSVTDPAACVEHARLMALSMRRRMERGEALSDDIRPAAYEPYLRCGAGELFQAVRDGTVLSSGLVLHARRGAYYDSSGTSPEGMTCGAAAFRVYESAKVLQERSLEVLNLGGVTPDNPGLYQFKVGLGAAQVPLECAGYCLDGPLWRVCKAALRRARDQFRKLFCRA
jgi:hypothetical protein